MSSRIVCSSLLCLVALASVATVQGKVRDLKQSEARYAYEKLNKHLEKTVNSESPEANMAEIERYYKEKASGCFPFGVTSYVEVMKRLVKFAALPEDLNVCDDRKSSEQAEFIDSGLADKERAAKLPSTTPANYPLTRLHKVIEHYAYLQTRYCGFDKRVPRMEYAYKLLAYDEINKRLVDELPGEDDVDKNMAKAEEMLKALGGPETGALADALGQFAQLKLTLNAEYCDERGYVILLRNDLGTRRNGHGGQDKPLRRVDKIYQHYARQHQRICRTAIVDTFKWMVKRLSPDTYRRVLGLMSTKYVESRFNPELMDELTKKEIDDKFYTSKMVETLQERILSFNDDRLFDLVALYSGNTKVYRIHDYLKHMAKGDPDSKHLALTVNEYEGKRDINEEGLKRVVNKYVYEPCDEFIAVFAGPIAADNFNTAINNHHHETTPRRMMDELTYHTVRMAYNMCSYAKYQLFRPLKDEIRREKYYES